MLKKNLLFFVFISIFFISCSKDTKKISVLTEKNLDMQVLDAYKEGMKELDSGYNLMAAKNSMKLKYYFPSLNGHPNHHLWLHMRIMMIPIMMIQLQNWRGLSESIHSMII